ncbi:MAG: hypothetical protein PHY12_08365 [Eubacteriales bacterium]|nr:hypothetical protein [Eubacteriales bacterium]
MRRAGGGGGEPRERKSTVQSVMMEPLREWAADENQRRKEAIIATKRELLEGELLSIARRDRESVRAYVEQRQSGAVVTDDGCAYTLLDALAIAQAVKKGAAWRWARWRRRRT